MVLESIDTNSVASMGTLAVIALRELIKIFRDDRNKSTKATEENTIAIAELKVEIRSLREKIDDLPQMRDDLNLAHAKLRNINT